MNPAPQPVGTGYHVPGNWAAGHHTGVDFLAPNGTPVKAGRAATVVEAGWYRWGRAYGLGVVLEATVGDKKLRCLMAHLQSTNVRVGQKVRANQIVAWSNNSGRSTGPHLHQEVRHWPYRYGDDVDPDLWNTATEKVPAAPAPGTRTVFDISTWNVASPRWFTPWAPRATAIGEEIKGEASVYAFQEVYSEEQAASIQKALGPAFTRQSAPFGLEFWFENTASRWMLERPTKSYEPPGGIQGRGAEVMHLIRRQTGQHVAFVNFHAPVKYDSLKTAYGRWLAGLLGQIDGPIALVGDPNRSREDRSPRKEIRAAGFRDFRELADVKNESADEFPSKGWNLCDIWIDTDDEHRDQIIGGEVDLTSARLSDHRRLDARVVVTA